MAAALRHRGPDGQGIEAGEWIGLAHTRLSILDLDRGAQPMHNEDARLSIVYNGEIFNFLELRRELEARGHVFRTRTDTEVVLHGWEEWGEALLPRLNGQFAFAIADHQAGTLILARDRFGILPLFVAERDGDLYFASEMKALFASGAVAPAMDPAGLDQIFTFWAVRAPRTPFRDVRSLRPGSWVRWADGRLAEHQWYALDLTADGEPSPADEPTLDALMRSSVGMRLLADVAVGTYVSGGLDSSIVGALAADESAETLRSFSVSFANSRFDESRQQREVAAGIGSLHAVTHIAPGDIGRVFPEVIRHTETPLVRTAPAPLFLLSQLVRDRGIKVVLSGEGADEMFWGYDLFKEAAVRLFCLRQPESRLRPHLFDRLHALDAPGPRGAEFWRGSFLAAGGPADPLFSHLPRIRSTSWIKRFYSAEFSAGLRAARIDPLEELRGELPAAFAGWTPMARAAYLEMVTLLSPYLLSSQGDRMAMANGVELRVPYLDHRVAEFAAHLPERSKLLGLRDKVLLRRWASGILPSAQAARPKQPYRAPVMSEFFGPGAPGYVEELLDAGRLRHAGIFDAGAVEGLVRRCRAGAVHGMREQQALVGVLSTQLWHDSFLEAGADSMAREATGPAIAGVGARGG